MYKKPVYRIESLLNLLRDNEERTLEVGGVKHSVNVTREDIDGFFEMIEKSKQEKAAYCEKREETKGKMREKKEVDKDF